MTPDHTLAVSRHFVGRASSTRQLVFDLADRPLLEPQGGLDRPNDEHVAWHAKQVFRMRAYRLMSTQTTPGHLFVIDGDLTRIRCVPS